MPANTFGKVREKFPREGTTGTGKIAETIHQKINGNNSPKINGTILDTSLESLYRAVSSQFWDTFNLNK